MTTIDLSVVRAETPGHSEIEPALASILQACAGLTIEVLVVGAPRWLAKRKRLDCDRPSLIVSHGPVRRVTEVILRYRHAQARHSPVVLRHHYS